MKHPGMVAVATTASRSEADVVASVLDASRVACIVDCDDAGQTNPEFTFTRFVRVLVRQEDLEQAQAILADARANGQSLPEAPDVESGL